MWCNPASDKSGPSSSSYPRPHHNTSPTNSPLHTSLCSPSTAFSQDVREGMKKWAMNKDLKSLKNEITMAIEKIPTDVNVDDDYEMQSERASERSEYASYPLTVLLNSNIPLPFASPPPPRPPSLANSRSRTNPPNPRINRKAFLLQPRSKKVHRPLQKTGSNQSKD